MQSFIVADINDGEEVSCHNGTCIDGIDTYWCDCVIGYVGSHCDEGKILAQIAARNTST